MPELIFVLILAVAAMALAINRAPIWLWSILAGAAAYSCQSALIYGRHEPVEFGLLSIFGWLPALVLAALSVPPLRRTLLVEPAFKAIRGVMPKVCPVRGPAVALTSKPVAVSRFQTQ